MQRPLLAGFSSSRPTVNVRTDTSGLELPDAAGAIAALLLTATVNIRVMLDSEVLGMFTSLLRRAPMFPAMLKHESHGSNEEKFDYCKKII